MVLSTKSVKNINIWHTIYPKKLIDIFKGKQQNNILNLLGSIAILGDSQTSDMAKFVLSYGRSKQFASKLCYRDYSKLQNNYSRLLSDNSFKLHGGKKILDEFTGDPKKNPNPVKLDYVIITGKTESTKGIPTPHYFLTLKGFLLTTGYEFNPSELKSMIDNASKISLFFCFIKTVMDNYSIDFVIEIFIKPIQKVLLRSDIFQGGDMSFYFSNFADAISDSLSKKMKAIDDKMKQDIMNKPDSYFSEKITREFMQFHDEKKFSELIRIKKNLEVVDRDDLVYQFLVAGIKPLMDNVFYSSKPKEDWYYSLVDHFYSTDKSKELFLKFGYDSERNLMYKVMQSISHAYTYFGYGVLHYKENKLPRSKAWGKNQKYKKPDKAFFKKHGSKFKPRDENDISNLY